MSSKTADEESAPAASKDEAEPDDKSDDKSDDESDDKSDDKSEDDQNKAADAAKEAADKDKQDKKDSEAKDYADETKDDHAKISAQKKVAAKTLQHVPEGEPEEGGKTVQQKLEEKQATHEAKGETEEAAKTAAVLEQGKDLADPNKRTNHHKFFHELTHWWTKALSMIGLNHHAIEKAKHVIAKDAMEAVRDGKEFIVEVLTGQKKTSKVADAKPSAPKKKENKTESLYIEFD